MESETNHSLPEEIWQRPWNECPKKKHLQEQRASVQSLRVQTSSKPAESILSCAWPDECKAEPGRIKIIKKWMDYTAIKSIT